jgi:hypothetical protein
MVYFWKENDMKRNVVLIAIGIALIASILLFINNDRTDQKNSDVKEEMTDILPNVESEVEDLEKENIDAEALEELLKDPNIGEIETEEDAIERVFSKILDSPIVDTFTEEINNEDQVIKARVVAKDAEILVKIFVNDSTSEEDALNLAKKYASKIEEKYPDKEISVELEHIGGFKVDITTNSKGQPDIHVLKAEKLHVLASIYIFELNIKLEGQEKASISAVKAEFSDGETKQLDYVGSSEEFVLDPNYVSMRKGTENVNLHFYNGETLVATKELEIPIRKE